MVKKETPQILKEEWERIEYETMDVNRIEVRGQEFYAFAGLGNLLFTPEEVEAGRARFKEWPNHIEKCPMWVLNKNDIIESAERISAQISDVDLNKIAERMALRIANIVGDDWGEALDEEVEFVVNNRLSKGMPQ